MSLSDVDRSLDHVITKENSMVTNMIGFMRRVWLWWGKRFR